METKRTANVTNKQINDVWLKFQALSDRKQIEKVLACSTSQGKNIFMDTSSTDYTVLYRCVYNAILKTTSYLNTFNTEESMKKARRIEQTGAYTIVDNLIYKEVLNK